MKFRMWLNENAWIDAAKDFLQLPSAMRDQDVIQHFGKLPDIVQQQMVSAIPYYHKMKENRAKGIQLTLFRNFEEVSDTINKIEEELQDQWKELEEVKKSVPKMKVRLEATTDPLAQTLIYQSTPAVPAEPAMPTLYSLEKSLGDAMTNTRKNHYEIRRMWDTLGWIEKKRSDVFAKTGMRGLGESSELGGDAAKYFPDGYAELQHKITQVVNQVNTMSRHIDGVLRSLGMTRQFSD